jgi:2'-5' RNA ligase
MVHSIELLFDGETEAAVRRIWDELADTAVKTPPGRPHVTLAVADSIAAEVDDLLRPLLDGLPLRCCVGASLLLGRSGAILARLIVPTADLLGLHAEVHRVCAGHLLPEPAPNSLPGRWTPHVTLARRVGEPGLSQTLRTAARPVQIDGGFAGLRRWDGDERVEYPISPRPDRGAG